MKKVKIKGYTRTKWLRLYGKRKVKVSYSQWDVLFDSYAMEVYIKGRRVLLVPLEVAKLYVDVHGSSADVGVIYKPQYKREESRL